MDNDSGKILEIAAHDDRCLRTRRANHRATLVSAFLVICAGLVDQPSAKAQEQHTANFLLSACRDLTLDGDPTNSFVVGYCAGEISVVTVTARQLPQKVRSCPPLTAPLSQRAKVVVSYLDRNPARLHESFIILAMEAFAEAWPCK